jgi:hypothetical protein
LQVADECKRYSPKFVDEIESLRDALPAADSPQEDSRKNSDSAPRNSFPNAGTTPTNNNSSATAPITNSLLELSLPLTLHLILNVSKHYQALSDRTRHDPCEADYRTPLDQLVSDLWMYEDVGETSHRYVLSFYDRVLEKVTLTFLLQGSSISCDFLDQTLRLLK